MSRRMLTATLRRLAAEGLVERRVAGSHVSYRLSGAGPALLPICRQLEGWARAYSR